MVVLTAERPLSGSLAARLLHRNRPAAGSQLWSHSSLSGGVRRRPETSLLSTDAPPDHTATFWVYVIELDPTGLGDVGAGAVYVGETARTPEARFVMHKAGGIKVAKEVAWRGVRLRPDLYPPEGPFDSRTEALRYERRTGNRLRHRGYRVYGAQGERFMKRKRAPQ